MRAYYDTIVSELDAHREMSMSQFVLYLASLTPFVAIVECVLLLLFQDILVLFSSYRVGVVIISLMKCLTQSINTQHTVSYFKYIK